MKYLFIAQFDDNSIFKQTPDDISLLDVKRSAFYDVLQSNKKLLRFYLFGENKEYCVDLADGSFIVNGAKFKLHEDEDLTNFRVIYFRRRQVDMVQGVGINEQILYFGLGWQALTPDGKNIKHVLKIK